VIPEFTPRLTRVGDFGFKLLRNTKSYEEQEGNGGINGIYEQPAPLGWAKG